MITKLDRGEFVIASGGSWLPGSYDRAKTARYAFQFTNRELMKARDAASPSPITLETLRAIRKARTARTG